VSKPIEDMSFQEQMSTLRKDPRFRQLVSDLQKDLPARRQALQDEMLKAETE
jgi:hypothetical protein